MVGLPIHPIHPIHEFDSTCARERFICGHLPLVHACVRELAPHPTQREDVTQAGTLGLIYAVDHFDPHRGVAFSTYAWPHIRGGMLHYLRDCKPSVRIPRRYREVCQKIRANQERLRQSLGHEPSLSDFADALGIRLCEVEAAARAEIACSVRSLDLNDGGLPDVSLETLAERTSLRDAIAQLSTEEQQIVAMTFWDGLTQQQAAALIGRSQMHVSRTLRRATDRLKEALSD